jgi:hypothetical protein
LTATGVTALLALDEMLVPTLFVAVTEKVYSVPLEREDTTQDNDELDATVTTQVPPAGFDLTVYEVMTAPPLFVGATQRTDARESPAIAETEVGASGDVARERGVAVAEPDGADCPKEFTERTRTETTTFAGMFGNEAVVEVDTPSVNTTQLLPPFTLYSTM